MAFRKVADIGELRSGEMKSLSCGGVRMLLVNVGEEVRAYEDSCPHLGVPLSEGRLEGRTLTCRAHYWEYDACTGAGISPSGICLRMFSVRIEESSILVDIESDPVGHTPSASLV